MIKKLLMLALTSGLAAKALQMWIDREGTRRDAAAPGSGKAGTRADVQRWEGEGGNAAPAADTPARKKPLRRNSGGAAAKSVPARKPRARRANTTNPVSA